MPHPVDAAPCDAEQAWIQRAISRAPGDSPPSFEPHLATDRRGNVLAAWIGAFGIESALSHDDGQTFARPGTISQSSADPTVASDGAGAFYVASLSGCVTVNRIDVASGQPGPTVCASGLGGAPDKPWIALDNRGTILVAFLQRTALVVARSTDGGRSFARTSVRAGTLFRSRLCVDRAGGPDAPVYLVYLDNNREVGLTRSLDGGATWPAQVPVASGAAWQDPDCAVRGSEVWVSLAAPAPLPTGSFDFARALLLFHSPDGGQTFEPPVVVARAALFLAPALALTDAGNLELLYYEGHLGQTAWLTHARSADGRSFTCAHLADAGPFPSDPREFGDYIGLAVAAGHMYAAFGDDMDPSGTQVSFARADAP